MLLPPDTPEQAACDQRDQRRDDIVGGTTGEVMPQVPPQRAALDENFMPAAVRDAEGNVRLIWHGRNDGDFVGRASQIGCRAII